MDEQALEELAVQEILKDLKRGAERAKEHGALGWQKNPAPPTNKRFLRNMLVSTLRDNRPFKRRNSSHRPDSNHRDPPPRKTSDSDNYFRYSDRYRQDKTNLDNGSDQRKDSCSDSQHHSRDFSTMSHPGYSGNSQKESGLCAAGHEIDISDFNHRSLHRRKRSRTSSSDSDSEVKNREESDRKKRKRERHRKTDAKDGRHSHERKKHKKSKKSKKHRSKHSGHSSGQSS